MSRKRTRRKYQVADPTSWAYVIARNWGMDPNRATRIINELRIAYQRMRDGQGSDEDFDALAGAFNLGLVRAEKIGQPVVDAMNAGIAALLEARALHERHGKYGFTGPGILPMNCAVDMYEEIFRASTPRQMQDAVTESARRMRQQLAGTA